MERSDDDIKRDVAEELSWDGRVDASDIGVAVSAGRVTLTGSVPSHPAREAAVLDSWAIPGVRGVDNRLTVRRRPKGPDDTAIVSRVQKVLDWDPEIDGSRIEVTANAGVVTLRGMATALWQKERARDLAVRVAGAAEVINEIVVVPVPDVVDETIAAHVERALERKASVLVADVDVQVRQGVVTLSGTVPNRSARNAAYNAALHTPGAVEVRDDLIIGGA
jgi:hyperosmotically inducible protein